MFDFLIVGAGLYGSTFAHQATKHGKKCLVIDKRSNAGGNIYCDNVDGITVHKYGAHIFHTNDKSIWDYVNSFVPFNRYIHTVVANYKGKLYNLPFNMNTFYQVWGLTDPLEIESKIKYQSGFNCLKGNYTLATNLEEQSIRMVGTDLYNIIIKEYTEKQWGRPCSDLPAFIIKRLPLRFTFDNSYFNDTYQGIPIGGYNKLIDGLLNGVELRLNADFFSDIDYFKSIAKRIVYTGPIDQYFNYCFGNLEYRSLSFTSKCVPVSNFQGCAVMNFTDKETPYTRIIEHKHFENKSCLNTVITYEYPLPWNPGREPYYPVNDEANNKRYRLYRDLAGQDPSLLISGRLGKYLYLDMHQVAAMALSESKKLL